jgi:hypothetical protein
MVANTAPIYSVRPNVDWTPAITAANTAKDGTGTTTLLFQAGADGSMISHIVAQPYGTNVASLARVFLNNNSSPATAANNSFFVQGGLPATTNSETAEVQSVIIPVGMAIDPNFRLYIVLATSVVSGWAFTCFGSDY